MGQWAARWRVWPWAGVLLLGLAAAGLLMGWLLRVASAQLLQRDAEHAALAWAELAASAVDELAPLLAGGPLSPQTRHDLRRLRRAQEVFRFQLFDRNGRPVLSSDALDAPLPVAPAVGGERIGHGDARVHERVLRGEPVVELHQGGAREPDEPDVYSEAYVPLRSAGRLIGVVEVYVDQTERAHRVHAAFGLVASGALVLLAVLGALFAAGWWRHARLARQDAERTRYLARHDVLSGLLNRTSFNEALAEAAWRQAQGGPAFAVLCLDLHHFKDVNSAQGHAAGDEVLRQVGERLRALVRHGDRVARLASDEFALLLSDGAAPEAVGQLAQRVIAALGEPFVLAGQRVDCGCSIGAAIFGVDAATPQALMHQADLALTRAKQIGAGGFSFYDAALDRALDDRRQLAADLRAAIGTPQLSLHYQPLFEAQGRGDSPRLCGYEALLRWRHPQRGPVSPAEFIPLAEETGLIDPLGRWVLHSACAEAASWPEALRVAVNLSAAQFRRGDLVAEVRQALLGSGLPAARLEIEITESLLMGNTEAVMHTLGELAELGVHIAMDDFGTGYSSLAYLWRFRFDKVKIDRAFTQHLESDPKVRLIVKSIVTLAHSLGIRVNGEGVETAAQLRVLRSLGCDELQGFLLGRPGPADSLPHRLPGGAEHAQSGAWQPAMNTP